MAKAITDVALIGLGAVGAAYLTSVADNFPECRIRVIAAGERAENVEREIQNSDGGRHGQAKQQPRRAVRDEREEEQPLRDAVAERGVRQ